MKRGVLLAVLLGAGVAPSGSADRVPACPGSVLRLSGESAQQGETGEQVAAFSLRNTGAGRCALFGYPGVRLLDRGGILPLDYRWGGRYYGTRHRPTTVVLAAGARARFVIAQYRCDGATLRTARSMAVYPPGSTRRLRLHLGRYPIFSYCRATRGPDSGDPGNRLSIGPVSR